MLTPNGGDGLQGSAYAGELQFAQQRKPNGSHESSAVPTLAPAENLLEQIGMQSRLSRRPGLVQKDSQEALLAPGSTTPGGRTRPSLQARRPFPLTLQLPQRLQSAQAGGRRYTGTVSPSPSLVSQATTPQVHYPPPPAEYPFPRLTDATAAATATQPTVFHLHTRFRTLWLLGLGMAGNAAYGMGSVIWERGLWTGGPGSLPPIGPDDGPKPGQGTTTAAAGANPMATLVPRPSLNGTGPALPGVAHAGNPDYNKMWGGRAGGLAVGATMTLAGVLMVATAATMLWQDNRRLMRRNHRKKGLAGEPSYFWPNFYFGSHLLGTLLLVSHRALIELTKDNVGGVKWVWIATLPGVLGSSIVSVTQSQSASGSEMFHGKMPLWKRHILAGVARGAVATYCLFGAAAATPGFNPYWRESLRLLAMNACTLSWFLQLTTARQLAANPSMLQAPCETNSWTPARRWALWLVGRALIGFGPNLFERGLYTLHLQGKDDQGRAGGINEHHFNVDGAGIATDMSVGSAMTTAGVLMDLLATGLMRNDAIANQEAQWYANVLLGGATLGSACMVTYRGIIEYAKDELSHDTLWLSTFPGTVGTALLFWTVPILFSYAELHHGDIPIEQRDRLTRVLRCISGMGFPLWGAMAAITRFNPFIREAVLISASLTFQLANALPTTTTRRGQPQFNFPRTPGNAPTPGTNTPAAMV